MTDQEAEELMPHADMLVEQVLERDTDAINAVVAGVRQLFRFSTLHEAERALLVVLAEMFVNERDRAEQAKADFVGVAQERDMFQRNYIDQKKRVRFWRDLVERKAGEPVNKEKRMD